MGSPEAPAEGYFGFESVQYCAEGHVAYWKGEDTPRLTYESMEETDGHGHGAMDMEASTGALLPHPWRLF